MGTHPTAYVAPDARLGTAVEIGPYAIVEEGACIGDRTRLLASVFVGAGSIIDSDCEIHAGAMLGVPPQGHGLRNKHYGGLRIGPRNIIREHVIIDRAANPEAATILGAENLLMAGCHIGHGCHIGNGTTIASGALLAGFVTLENGAVVSGNVGIHQHVRVGRLSMIAGLSRASKDVLPFVLVIGHSEVCGLNVVGMRRAKMTAAERLNVKRAYAVVYRSGLNVRQAVARMHEMPRNAEMDVWLAFIAESKRGLCRARRPIRC